MKPNVWMADRISFRVQGKNVQRFLNTSVEQGIRLDHLRWETDGFTARGAGRDISKLKDLAKRELDIFCVPKEGTWNSFGTTFGSSRNPFGRRSLFFAFGVDESLYMDNRLRFHGRGNAKPYAQSFV